MEHGGDLDRVAKMYQMLPEDMLDLSTGISPAAYPLGPLDQSAWQALLGLDQQAALLACARKAYNLPHEADICMAAGSQTLLQAIPRLLPPQQVWMTNRPTYNEHAPAWQWAGHNCVFAVDLPKQASSAVIVNPNNPDGYYTKKDQILACAAQCRERGGMLLVDEAFIDPQPWMSYVDCAAREDMIIIRSFGKFYGLAGLRLGFAIGAPSRIAQLRRHLGPWPVATPALQAGQLALADENWASAHRLFLASLTDKVKASFMGAGIEFIGGTSLFSTFSAPPAASLQRALARMGIWTRIYQDHPSLIRFGTPANEHIIAKIAKIIKQWHQQAKN